MPFSHKSRPVSVFLVLAIVVSLFAVGGMLQADRAQAAMPTWTRIATNGIDNPAHSLAVPDTLFAGRIYFSVTGGAQGPGVPAAAVWTYDGSHFIKAAADGFGNAANIQLSSGKIYDGYIYIGTNKAELWRTADWTNWERIGQGTFDGTNRGLCNPIGIYDGKLIVVVDDSVAGAMAWSYDGSTLARVNTDGFGIGIKFTSWHIGQADDNVVNVVGAVSQWGNFYAVKYMGGTTWQTTSDVRFGDPNNNTCFVTFNTGSEVYGGTNNANGGKAYKYDGSAWSQIDLTGTLTPADNTAYPMKINGELMVASAVISGGPPTGAGKMWRQVSGAWEKFSPDGFGDANNTEVMTTLVSGGYYYAMGFNMAAGFQIWRSPLPQPTQKPVITSVLPARGPVGTQVTIKGTNFGNRPGSGRGIKYAAAASNVMFNQTQATDYTTWTDTEIKVKVPNGAVPGPVTVFTSAGTSNANYTFTPTYPLTPFYFLAEGSTGYGFETYINIENPNAEDVNASVNFLLANGSVKSASVGLPKQSQTTVNPREYVGDADFSTRVDCVQGKMIAVDRTMVWTGQGASAAEAHSSIGTTSPQKTWYLAEGSANWGFETWTLVENANGAPTNVTLSYMLEGGGVIEKTKTLAANSRASFSMADAIGPQDASILVTSDLPVVTERAMYRNNKREGHCSIGTPSPGTNFFLAEGTTAWGFTTYVLLQNSNPTPAKVTLTYMTPGGPVPQAPFTMPASSRKTVKVNDQLPNSDFSIRVASDMPVVAERAMYWDSPAGEACHASSGVCSSHMNFYLPDGSTTERVETYTLVANPNSGPVDIEVSYLLKGGGEPVTFTDTIAANSRKTYAMSDKIPNGAAAIVVKSKTPGRGIMAERSMYWNSRSAGTDTIGGFSD
jgi:hypothetical protein